MRVIWREQAEADLDEHFNYLRRRGAGAVALRTAITIRQRVAMLADHPGLGRLGRLTDTRELVIARTPFIVMYSVDQRLDTVTILRVLHGAQQWPDDLSL
jgi:toxin ParE1/3/4